MFSRSIWLKHANDDIIFSLAIIGKIFSHAILEIFFETGLKFMCLPACFFCAYIYNGNNLSRLKILLRVPYSSVILVLVVWFISYTWNISAPNFNMICLTIPVADYIGAFQDALLLWILLAIFGLSYKLSAWHLWPTNTHPSPRQTPRISTSQ